MVNKVGPAEYDDDDRHAVVYWSYNPKVEGSLSIHNNIFHHIDAAGYNLEQFKYQPKFTITILTILVRMRSISRIAKMWS